MLMQSKDNHILSHPSSYKGKRAKRYMCDNIGNNKQKTCAATKKGNKKKSRGWFGFVERSASAKSKCSQVNGEQSHSIEQESCGFVAICEGLALL